MYIFNLLSNPISIIPLISAILLAFTIHEFSHALVAELLGDPTPNNLGRLTLNPLAHIDLFGLLLLFFVGFGWPKPVLINSNNLKNPKWGSVLVSLAGPLSNLLVTLLTVLITYLLITNGLLPVNSLLTQFLSFLIYYNVILMIFNLLPIPPLDGSKIFFAFIPERYSNFRQTLDQYGPMILLLLIIFDTALPISILGSMFNFVLLNIDRLFF